MTYSPNLLFVGADSFTYEGMGADGTRSATVTISINVGTPLPLPVEGKSANLYQASGKNYVQLPGQAMPVRVDGGIQVPLGAKVDARRGRVGIFVRRDKALNRADFASGLFEVKQSRETSPHARLTLLRDVPKARCAIHRRSFAGSFDRSTTSSNGPADLTELAAKVVEPSAGGARAAVTKKKPKEGKPVRRLWGAVRASSRPSATAARPAFAAPTG